VISEHLIKRYDVQERIPKAKSGPALHNSDMEQKRPRRKDTPALHMPPFVAGKKQKQKQSWSRTFTAGMGALSRCKGHALCPVSWPSKLCCIHMPRRRVYALLPSGFSFISSSPGDDLGEEKAEK
jgi:hypothetical protein